MKIVLGLLFFFLSQVVSAGIDVKVGAGNIAGILGREAQYHVDAVLMAIADNRAVVANEFQMNNLRARIRGVTVGRFEYTYQINGKEFTRVYHARSGRSVRGMVGDSKYSSGGTSSEPGGSGTIWEDIERDAREGMFYPADTPENVRAANLRPIKNSGVVSSGVKSDAELKALRSIQTDIVNGRVPPGGKLTAYVTKAPCPSCEEVIRVFAGEYKVNGNVFHMIETPVNAEVTGESLVAESMRASQEYFRAQARRVEDLLKTGKVTKPTSITWGEDTTRLLRNSRELELSGPPSRCK
jgi:hypothetical protein